MKNRIHFKRVVSLNVYLSIKEFLGDVANILDFKFVHFFKKHISWTLLVIFGAANSCKCLCFTGWHLGTPSWWPMENQADPECRTAAPQQQQLVQTQQLNSTAQSQELALLTFKFKGLQHCS